MDLSQLLTKFAAKAGLNASKFDVVAALDHEETVKFMEAALRVSLKNAEAEIIEVEGTDATFTRIRVFNKKGTNLYLAVGKESLGLKPGDHVDFNTLTATLLERGAETLVRYDIKLAAEE